MDAAESERLHWDWWGQCRTCRFWPVPDRANLAEAACQNPDSDMRGKVTTSTGYCPKWDSFDVDTALTVLRKSEEQVRKN